MKILTPLLALGLLAAAYAQNQPILGEDTVKVSDHVWAIMGFPNIGIVVGGNATLVVDTGLGPRNGATVAKVAKKLAPQNKLYLTTWTSTARKWSNCLRAATTNRENCSPT